MARSLPTGYLIYNMDFIPDYVFDKPLEINNDFMRDGYYRLNGDSDLLIESDTTIELKIANDTVIVEPGRYYFDYILISGFVFYSIAIKDPHKHKIMKLNIKESINKIIPYEYFRANYPIIFKNMKIIKNGVVTDEHAVVQNGIFGAYKLEYIKDMARKKKHSPTTRVIDDTADKSKLTFTSLVYSYDIKTIMNDPDVYQYLTHRPVGIRLSSPPCADFTYTDANRDALSTVLDKKYGRKLVEEYTNYVFRDKETDEINKNIDDLWEGVVESERAGIVRFIPVV